MHQPNPPEWATKALEKFWPALKREVGLQELPVGGPEAQELGCGLYGCVWSTSTPNLVLKITSDRTEAAFAAASMTLPYPGGIVRYHRLYQIGGERRERRQLYALWRDEVHLVGIDRMRYGLALDALNGFKAHAQTVRALATRLTPDAQHGLLWLLKHDDDVREGAELGIQGRGYWKDKAVSYWNQAGWREWEFDDKFHAAIHLAACRMIARIMQTEPNLAVLHAVGKALEFYIDQGILLSDVHGSNVGRIGSLYGEVVITDPGQAVFLDHERWSQITVPVLYEPKAKRKKLELALDAVRAALVERLRAMLAPMDPEAVGYQIAASDTSPTGFRVDILTGGMLVGQVDVELTPKGARVESAAVSWIQEIIRDVVKHDLPMYKGINTKSWKLKQIDLGEAAYTNPPRKGRK